MWFKMSVVGAFIALLVMALPKSAGAQEKNLVVNGDFSDVAGTGGPVGWNFSAKAGHPQCRTVNDAQGPRLSLDMSAGDAARLSQQLPLQAEHSYIFQCEYRIDGHAPALPNVAVRISADTKKGLWRIWDASKPEPSADWRPLELEFLVPSDITAPKVGVTYFINDNRNAGRIELRHVRVVEKPLTDHQRQHAYTATDGSVYFPRQTQPAGSDPALPESIRNQPLFWWTGKDADGVLPAEAPELSRINQPLSVSLAGGADGSMVLVLQANRPLTGLNIQLADVPPFVSATLKHVDVWRQRMGYRSGFYEMLPERLLDLPQTVDLSPGQRLQLFLRLKADAAAKSGRMAIAIQHEGQTLFRAPIEVRVLPFNLSADAPQPIWGLYPDPGRWRNFTPQAMDRELKWLHDCGIRTLLLYMPLDRIAANQPLDDDHLPAALDRWRAAINQWGDRYMDHFVKAGFGPIWVCNVQSLPGALARAAGVKPMGEEDQGKYDPRLLRYIHDYLQVIEQVRIQRGWPPFHYHLVDEPGGGANAAAVAEYGVLRSLNLKGYTTANQAAVVRDFRGSVEIFAISNGVFTSPAEWSRLKNWIGEYPDAQLWWYGAAGAYSGQDGCLNKNRFGMGFFTWMVGAKGGFLWTYQRVSGSAFDDFDGASKEMCLTYPPEDPAERYSGEAVSTLQWEGVRDGMTDYRYLQLLDQRLDAAQKRGDTPQTRQIASEVAAFRKSLWDHPQGTVSNETLNQWRNQAARWIEALSQDPHQ